MLKHGHGHLAQSEASEYLVEQQSLKFSCHVDSLTRQSFPNAFVILFDRGDPTAIANRESLLTILIEHLPHSDTYIYLSAVNGKIIYALHYITLHYITCFL